jgi:SAM-dependent methyltransferase
LSWDLDYGRYYSRFHYDSPSHQAWQVSFNRRILGPHLPQTRGTPGLDIGCGLGFGMFYLQEEGFQPVEGVDIDPGQVAASRQKGLTVHQTGDCAAFLAERQHPYGTILAMDVLEHMSRAEQLAVTRAIHDALLPGGRLLCSVPNANSAIAPRQRYNDFTHHGSFTEHSLDFLLFNSGFRDIRIEGYEFYQPPHRVKIGPKDFRRPHHFISYLGREYLRGILLRFVRGFRRLEMIGELGFEVGKSIPLSLNLLGAATKE